MTKSGHRRAHKPIGDPESINPVRANIALKAVRAYQEATSYQDDDGARCETPQAIADLLANLAHLCDREGLSLRRLLRQAQERYEKETQAEHAGQANGGQFDGVYVPRRLGDPR